MQDKKLKISLFFGWILVCKHGNVNQIYKLLKNHMAKVFKCANTKRWTDLYTRSPTVF